jgi:hypothetical protein
MRFPGRFLACAALSCVVSGACAQDAAPRLQDAIVTARGSTISITRLPIRTPQGTIYRDVTIELRVDSQGRVTLATDSAGRAVAPGMPPAPAQVALRSVPSRPEGAGPPDEPAIALPQRPSPPINFQHFTPGTYGAHDGSLIRLQDRGMDLVHHVPAWSITAEGGAQVGQLTFYSGPYWMNPRAGRLKRSNITSPDYAYGTADEGGSGRFETGALIGVAQDGNRLHIVSFSKDCCVDRGEPTGELVFTRVGR